MVELPERRESSAQEDWIGGAAAATGEHVDTKILMKRGKRSWCLLPLSNRINIVFNLNPSLCCRRRRRPLSHTHTYTQTIIYSLSLCSVPQSLSRTPWCSPLRVQSLSLTRDSSMPLRKFELESERHTQFSTEPFVLNFAPEVGVWFLLNLAPGHSMSSPLTQFLCFFRLR